MSDSISSAIRDVAQQFISQGQLVSLQPFGEGNVNDTYLVMTTGDVTGDIAGGSENDRFLLQRINQQVFHQPRLIAANLRVYTEHVQRRLDQEVVSSSGGQQAVRHWETPSIISTRSGEDYVEDAEGEFWRAISFVDEAKTYPIIRDAAHASEAGYALGRFHSLVSDLDPALLHDTLEGFHITPKYLIYFDEVHQRLQMGKPNVAKPNVGQTAVNLTDVGVVNGLDFVARNRHRADVLEVAKARGLLTQRTIHGDPKVDNILISDITHQAVSIIDLDTVKPGLVHYDIGDCLRSCCNPLGEDAEDLDQARFELDLCQVILEGYLPIVKEFFTDADYDYMVDSIWLITFELGLRFFTDYLAGDVYFKARYPTHNLQRGLVQFKLAESIEAQENEIRRIVASFR